MLTNIPLRHGLRLSVAFSFPLGFHFLKAQLIDFILFQSLHPTEICMMARSKVVVCTKLDKSLNKGPITHHLQVPRKETSPHHK